MNVDEEMIIWALSVFMMMVFLLLRSVDNLCLSSALMTNVFIASAVIMELVMCFQLCAKRFSDI